MQECGFRHLSAFFDITLFRVQAPKDFTFVKITGTSVAIVVTEPMENNVIKHFEAYVKGGRP